MKSFIGHDYHGKIVNNYVHISLPDVTLFSKAVRYSGIA
jgi:hypothetical protein